MGQWAPVGSARSINRRWARRRGLDDGASGLFLEYCWCAAATTTATLVLVVVLPVDRLMGQNRKLAAAPEQPTPAGLPQVESVRPGTSCILSRGDRCATVPINCRPPQPG